MASGVGRRARVRSHSTAETGITTHLLQLRLHACAPSVYLPVPCLAFFFSPPSLRSCRSTAAAAAVWDGQVHVASAGEGRGCCLPRRPVRLLTCRHGSGRSTARLCSAQAAARRQRGERDEGRGTRDERRVQWSLRMQSASASERARAAQDWMGVGDEDGGEDAIRFLPN